MQGELSNPGVVPRAIQDVFDIIEKTPGRDFLLRMSMMEIYNEASAQPAPCPSALSVTLVTLRLHLLGLNQCKGARLRAELSHADSLIASWHAHFTPTFVM